MTKISVLLFYKRIFLTPANGPFRVLIWFLIWLVIIWMVTMEFASMCMSLLILSMGNANHFSHLYPNLLPMGSNEAIFLHR